MKLATLFMAQTEAKRQVDALWTLWNIASVHLGGLDPVTLSLNSRYQRRFRQWNRLHQYIYTEIARLGKLGE